MNAKNEKSTDEIIALKILDELAEDSDITQRTLSEKLGIALGLVNTYIKHFVKKGYIRITQFPKARYKYLLTPEGIAEKSRLVYKHLSYYNNLFKTVREDSLKLFKKLEKKGVKELVFCGVDEAAEISYLSLKETNIKLVDVYDFDFKKRFLDMKVKSIEDIDKDVINYIFISTLKNKKIIFEKLVEKGIKQDKIIYLGALD